MIKLSRIGKKNQPSYRLIVTEKSRDPFGKPLEILGSYNPFAKVLQAKNDRVNYWISQGAKMTTTVNNLLIDKGVVKGEKIRVTRGKAKDKSETNEPAEKNE